MNKEILFIESEAGVSENMLILALFELGADKQYADEQVSCLSMNHSVYVIETAMNEILASAMEPQVKDIALKIIKRVADADASYVLSKMQIIHIILVSSCLNSIGVQYVSLGKIAAKKADNTENESIFSEKILRNLLKDSGIAIQGTGWSKQELTPIGLAILAAIQNIEAPTGDVVIKNCGLGCPKSEAYGMRVMLLQEKTGDSTLRVLESNMDDVTGEQMGFLLDRLFAIGVRDALYIPVFMKKNRPAYMLQVILDEELREEAEELIFAESTTIGIRSYKIDRTILERRIETVTTAYGDIRIKVCRGKSVHRGYPEYEDVKKAAEASGQSFRLVYDAAYQKGENL